MATHLHAWRRRQRTEMVVTLNNTRSQLTDNTKYINRDKISQCTRDQYEEIIEALEISCIFKWPDCQKKSVESFIFIYHQTVNTSIKYIMRGKGMQKYKDECHENFLLYHSTIDSAFRTPEESAVPVYLSYGSRGQ